MSERFTSRSGLLLAALGMAIGTGNIWRFPRVIAQNGGCAFLIPWSIFLFVWAIPLLVAEFTIGQRTRQGLFGSFVSTAGKKYGCMGGFVAMVTFFILSYYAVVTGWCMSYIFKSIFSWDAITSDSSAVWECFASDPFQKVIFQLASIVLAAGVIYKGVVGGIEKANKFLIPSIGILIVVLAVKAITLPGSETGIRFLFIPQFAYLAKPKTWLEALSQTAWSTGAGWGLMLVYATYSTKKEKAAFISLCTGIGNNTASLIAATAIVPTIFALLPVADAQKILEGGNQGLAFISIPGLMTRLGGGQIFSTLFFVALFFAAFSSLISMFELSVKTLSDFSVSRKKGVAIVSLFVFLVGLPSAVSMEVFNNQDWVWGLGLIISGFFFSIAFWKMGRERFFREHFTPIGRDLLGTWIKVCLGFLVPVLFILIVFWWFYTAITEYDPDFWWHPMRQFSVGTCIVQWAVLLVALIVLWRLYLYKKCET